MYHEFESGSRNLKVDRKAEEEKRIKIETTDANYEKHFQQISNFLKARFDLKGPRPEAGYEENSDNSNVFDKSPALKKIGKSYPLKYSLLLIVILTPHEILKWT